METERGILGKQVPLGRATRPAAQVYNATFFRDQRNASMRSALRVAPIVVDLVRPASVIDVGCGIGTWAAAFSECGVCDVLGVDGQYVDPNSLCIPKDRFIAHDLATPLRLDRTFDLAISLEVGEHLPPAAASGFVDSLTSLSPVVLFSAAAPYQGGNAHINEQWPEFWAGLFRKRGFLSVDALRPLVWTDEAVQWWYAQNMFVAVRKDVLPSFACLRDTYERDPVAPRPMPHPERYEVLGYQNDTDHMSIRAALRSLLIVTGNSVRRRLGLWRPEPPALRTAHYRASSRTPRVDALEVPHTFRR